MRATRFGERVSVTSLLSFADRPADIDASDSRTTVVRSFVDARSSVRMVVRSQLAPRPPIDEETAVKRAIESHAREYYSHCSCEEFELELRETLRSHGARFGEEDEDDSGGSDGGSGAGTARETRKKCGLEAHVVKRLVTSALDRGARERELTAKLLCAMRESGTLDADDFERGFDRVLAEMADLKLDFPDALEECGTFLARAVADDVVAVTYLERACAREGYGEGKDVAKKVKWTLEDVGGEKRVRQAWGGPEGYNAENARVEMRDIIDEYLMSKDAAEAERRVRRLSMSFYHHELVKKALNIAIVQSILTPNVVEKVMDLLKYLGQSSVVNGSQMAKGFARTAIALKDISIDVPSAPEIFSELVERAKSAGLLPTGLSAWASVKPAMLGGRGMQGKAQLLRLDSAPDLTKLARLTSKSPNSSRSASPSPLNQAFGNMSMLGNGARGLTRMGSATKKQINAGWNGLRAETMKTNITEAPKPQGFDSRGVLNTPVPTYKMSHLFAKRVVYKPEGMLKSKRGLKRTNSAPGGLDELDTSRFVRPVGLVHDYMPFSEKYDLLDTLGTGGFAVVRKARHKQTGDIVAVKTLSVGGDGKDNSDDESGNDSSSDSDEEEEGTLQSMTLHEVKRELVMMQQLSQHPHIVTIREFFTEQNDEVVHVVMDILEGEELDDLVNERKHFTEDEVKTVMRAMLDAVAFMHGKGVIHRDLKLENFVLSEKGNLSSLNVVDFGLAKALNARQKAQHVCGTLSYIAPEALLAGVYGQGVDVWALGVAMHVLLTNTWPFDDDDEDELFEQIIECDLDFDTAVWAPIGETAKDLIQGLLEPSPKRRLTAAQALEHAWFTGQPSHTSDVLHNMHTRLENLISISRQPPERRFKDGDSITRQGEPADEFFIILSGECKLVRDNEVVGIRRVGNFVGELRNLEASGEEETLLAWTSAYAVGEVRALVFQDTDVQWAYQFDYRLTFEFDAAIRTQRKKVSKEESDDRKRRIREKREAEEALTAMNRSASEHAIRG